MQTIRHTTFLGVRAVICDTFASHIPGWSDICCVVQANLENSHSPASTSQALGSQLYTTAPNKILACLTRCHLSNIKEIC